MPALKDKSNKTVLVVEDEKPIRTLVVTALRRDGYTVLEAGSPGEAAEVIGSDLFNIDLLLADIAMPGMSGTDFAREMLAMRPALKVVFATGASHESIKGDLAPHQLFLQKPYTADQLREAVRSTLEG